MLPGRFFFHNRGKACDWLALVRFAGRKASLSRSATRKGWYVTIEA